MQSVNTSVSIIKDPDNPLHVRMSELQGLLANLGPEPPPLNLHISIQRQLQQQSVQELPQELAPLLSYSQFQLADSLITDSHLVAVTFLLKMSRWRFVGLLQMREITVKMIDIVQQFQIQEDNFQDEAEFLIRVMDWIDRMFFLDRWTLQNQIIGQLLGGSNILHKQTAKLLTTRLHSETCFLGKIFFFVRVSGLNPKTSQVFSKALSLMSTLNMRVHTLTHSLSNIILIRDEQDTQVDVYGRISTLEEAHDIQEIKASIGKIQAEMSRILRQQGDYSFVFLNLQKIGHQCKLQDILFRIMALHQNREVCERAYSLLSIYATNNYENAQVIMRHFVCTDLPLNSEDWGQYQTLCSIAKIGILSEPRYYEFVCRLISGKRYIPGSNNQALVDILVFLAVQYKDKNKIIRLIPNSQTLKQLLNTPSTTKFYSPNIHYAGQCIRFLLQLKTKQQTKEFTQAIGQSLNVLDLLGNVKKRNFFVSPSPESLTELNYQKSLFQLIQAYNLYLYVPSQQLYRMSMQSLQAHLMMLRTQTPPQYQKTLMFLETMKLDVQSHDILTYCSEFLYVVLVVSIHLIQSIGDDGMRLSLKRMGLLLATEIAGTLEVYLSEKEYADRKSQMDKLLRVMQKDFQMEPELKYYYNFNTEVRLQEVEEMPDQKIFRKEKLFMLRYQIQRTLSEYFFSQDLRLILVEQEEQARQRLLMAINKNEASFVHHLMFLLQDDRSHEKHFLALGMLKQLLSLEQEDHSVLVIKYGFVPIFYKLLETSHPYSSQLLEVSHKLLRRSNQEINKNVQQEFEKSLLEGDKSLVLNILRKYVEELVELEQTSLPVIRQVQGSIRDRMINPFQSHFHAGILVIVFIQYLCQSLNLQVKNMFGCSRDSGQSILACLLYLLKTAASGGVMMSRYKSKIVVQCLKTIGSLLRGPHQRNIQRALYCGYQRALLAILQVQDSLDSIIDRVSQDQVRQQLVTRSHLGFLEIEQENFFSNLLEPQLAKRQGVFDIIQIQNLKSLALSEVIVVMDYFSKSTLKMFYDVSKANLTAFMEKAEKVYGKRDQDLQRLMTIKKSQNMLERIISLDFQNVVPNQEIVHKQQISKSLRLQLGINLFIVMSRYEQKQKIDTIKQSVYRYVNSLRLQKRYNQNVGIFYQLYRLIRDTLGMAVGWVISLFGAGKSILQKADQTSLLTDDLKYKKAVDFFAKNIATIEIRMDNKDITISFPLLLEQRCITKSIRKDLIRNLDYSSSTEGLRTFMETMSTTLLRIDCQRRIQKINLSNKGLAIILKNRELWKNLSFFLAVAQNAIMVYKQRMSPTVYQGAFYAARSWQYFFALLILVIFVFESFRIRTILAQTQLDQKGSLNRWYRCIYTTWFVATDKSLVYACFYILFTTLGIRWEVAVSVLLLDFFYRFKATRFLLEMVIHVWPSLLSNIVFFVVTLYIIVVIAGTDLTEAFFQESCDTYATCVQLMFYTMQKIESTQASDSGQFRLGPKGVASISFTILITLIYRGLFLGIMIDQKRTVREAKELEMKAIKQRCFICGQTKVTINKREGMEKGFKKHVELEHNLWNYIYYLSYISELSPEDITLQEQIILNQFKNKEYDWIPLKSI